MNRPFPFIPQVWIGILTLLMTGFTQADPTMEDGTHLQIKLVTIGPGDDLTNWWGHNGLIVENSVSGQSYFYNYGLYSFDENFIYNFVKGRLIFEVDAFRTDAAIRHYRGENRQIQVQTLNLSPSRRLNIARRLEENIKPENRQYLYHHYLDNCATRIRDLIDRELDGQLKEFAGTPAPLTLRELTRCFTHHHFIWTWLLMFPMNDSIDQPITAWDEMFLPVKMEDIFRKFQYRDADGQVKPLVIAEETVYAATEMKDIPDSPPDFIFYTFLISLALSLLVLLSLWLVRRGKPLLFGLFNFFIGLLMGFLGLFLTLVSLFTDHTIAYDNENILLTNPLSALIPVLAILYLLRKKWSVKWLSYLWYVHAALGILAVILKIVPAFDQDNSLALVTFLPLYFTFTASFFIIRTGR